MGQGELFDRLASSDVLYHYPQESLDKLNGLVRVKGCLLDVGCGDGIIGQAYDAKTVVGVDISTKCAHRAPVMRTSPRRVAPAPV